MSHIVVASLNRELSTSRHWNMYTRLRPFTWFYDHMEPMYLQSNHLSQK